MIAEQLANADSLGKGTLTKRRDQGVAERDPFDQDEKKRDEKGRCHDLERLQVAGQGCQDRRRTP